MLSAGSSGTICAAGATSLDHGSMHPFGGDIFSGHDSIRRPGYTGLPATLVTVGIRGELLF